MKRLICAGCGEANWRIVSADGGGVCYCDHCRSVQLHRSPPPPLAA